MKPHDVTVAAPLNVMTYNYDFACEGWMNQPSSSPYENMTTNGTNQLGSILKTFMQETKSQFQAHRESIKNLKTQIDQITTSLWSWEYDKPKPTDVSDKNAPEAETEYPIIVTETIDLSNPDLQKEMSTVTSLIFIEISCDVPESGSSRIFFQEIKFPPFHQRINKINEHYLFINLTFTKDEELD